MQSTIRAKTIVLDPRTKIAMVLTVSIIMLSGGDERWMQVIYPILMAFPLLFLLAGRKYKAIAVYCGIYAAAYASLLLVAPLTSGMVNFLLLALCGIFSRFMPSIMMGYFLVSTTTVSEFMAAMNRMHVTEKISIPISVMFRFFPTVGEEYTAIRDAMKMRGIRMGGGNPAAMLEYRLVPMMMSTVKIGEELSSAALTRGLGAPVARTNVCRIGFRMADYLLLAVCVLACLVFFVQSFIV